MTEDFWTPTHPGFEITCEKCSSKEVSVESTLGFSELSGMWGSVDLVCLSCACRVEIIN